VLAVIAAEPRAILKDLDGGVWKTRIAVAIVSGEVEPSIVHEMTMTLEEVIEHIGRYEHETGLDCNDALAEMERAQPARLSELKAVGRNIIARHEELMRQIRNDAPERRRHRNRRAGRGGDFGDNRTKPIRLFSPPRHQRGGRFAGRRRVRRPSSEKNRSESATPRLRQSPKNSIS
jgi:hypothetical protein